MESCRDHADALYALGLIRSGDDTLAMESVVNAIVAASANPLFVDADQVQMWRLVAPNVVGPDRRAQSWPDPSRAGEEWAPSALEQEMIALKAAGRTPSDIDALVRTRPVLRSVR